MQKGVYIAIKDTNHGNCQLFLTFYQTVQSNIIPIGERQSYSKNNPVFFRINKGKTHNEQHIAQQE